MYIWKPNEKTVNLLSPHKLAIETGKYKPHSRRKNVETTVSSDTQVLSIGCKYNFIS